MRNNRSLAPPHLLHVAGNCNFIRLTIFSAQINETGLLLISNSVSERTRSFAVRQRSKSNDDRHYVSSFDCPRSNLRHCSNCRVAVVLSEHRYNDSQHDRRLMFEIGSHDPRHFTINECRIILARVALGEEFNVEFKYSSDESHRCNSISEIRWEPTLEISRFLVSKLRSYGNLILAFYDTTKKHPV
jgi:hypothetical protein